MDITVTRAFLMGGAVQQIGKRIDVDIRLARELIALGKAEPAQPLPAQAAPMTTDTAPGLVPGKKGKSNAGE